MVIALMLTACGSPDGGTAPTTDPTTVTSPAPTLSSARLAHRASLDLRGLRPDFEDVQRAEEGDLDVLIEEYLAHPAFEDRVRQQFQEAFRTVTDAYLIDSYSFDLSYGDQSRLQRTSGEEPLRVLARVAADDMPIGELTMGDWTMADPLLGSLYPVDYPSGSEGWQPVSWTDGRPEAGLLATNGLWWRYGSTFGNANRGRANAVSRLFLCYDFLSAELDFDRTDGLEADALEDAVKEDPACQACHEDLDPLGSYLYGFWYMALGTEEVTQYHPARERTWVDITDTPPGYFGESGGGLDDLGRQLAEDPRFYRCLADRVGTALLGRDADLTSLDRAHQDALGSSRLLKDAYRSVMSSDAYRAADPLDGGVPLKLSGPELMASQVEGLTGFVWADGTTEVMTSDLVGYLTLAGGADGYFVTRGSSAPSATHLLVHQRLAEAAGTETAVTESLADQQDVFEGIDLYAVPGRDEVLDQLVVLHRRLYGVERTHDDPLLMDQADLMDDLLDYESDPRLAWGGLLAALLADPDLLLY